MLGNAPALIDFCVIMLGECAGDSKWGDSKCDQCLSSLTLTITLQFNIKTKTSTLEEAESEQWI